MRSRTMRRPGKATVRRRARAGGPVFKARDVARLIDRLDRTVAAATGVGISLRGALWETENRDTARRAERARAKREATDRAAVEKAIKSAGGNLGRAAGVLGCSLGALYSMIHRAGLQLEVGGSRGKVKAIPNAVQIGAWISRELAARTKAEAAREGITASTYLRRALEASLSSTR